MIRWHRVLSLVILVLLSVGVWISPVSGFDIRDGDTLVISSPVSDDLLITGSSVIINAPVRSVTFAGGELIVNAPIEQNLIAAGGTIQVNAPVGADIIAAGGEIAIHTDVSGKILAVGGVVDINGSASNIAVSAGTVHVPDRTLIQGDALISSSHYQTNSAGDQRELIPEQRSDTAPSFDFRSIETMVQGILFVLWILFNLGLLILGLILIKFLPGPFEIIVQTLREKAIISLVLGVSACIVGIVGGLLLTVSIIGIPIAIFIGLFLFSGWLLSPLVTGAALGQVISGLIQRELKLTWAFILGFVVLAILFLIPVIGLIAKVVTLFIGIGSILVAISDNR